MSAVLARKPAPIEQLYCSAERVILLQGTFYNVNLRELYEARFGPWQGEDVRFVLARGARILSRRADMLACRTGYWPDMKAVQAWRR